MEATLLRVYTESVGLPRELLSDRGSNLTLKLIKEVTKRLRIDHIKSSPYHPEPMACSKDGMVLYKL